jgi:hypothetical protein
MSFSPLKTLAKILGVQERLLRELDLKMSQRVEKTAVLQSVAEENETLIEQALREINSGSERAEEIRGRLRQTIVKHEKVLMEILTRIADHSEFNRMAILAREIAKPPKGYFLKKELIASILQKHPPLNLLRYFGYESVPELLRKEEPVECMSALRFVESEAWMHETFEKAYGVFTPADFEEREIEIRILGPRWGELPKRFIAKKHHNVSHLKEFGTIFLNPIQENIPGKLLRDFALLLHYFYEIQFYSNLFKKYSALPDFSNRLKSLLRGDVKEKRELAAGEWLITQRYLWKEDPGDPRLYLPRVNPESFHWAKGERDLGRYLKNAGHPELSLWYELDWVGGLFPGTKGEELVSFDLEDNAMSLVSFMEGKEEFFIYHQQEALWLKIFSAYVGGEENAEKILLENFERGIITF